MIIFSKNLNYRVNCTKLLFFLLKKKNFIINLDLNNLKKILLNLA